MGINSSIIITSYSQKSNSYLDIPFVILHTMRYGHYAMFSKTPVALCDMCIIPCSTLHKKQTGNIEACITSRNDTYSAHNIQYTVRT